MRNVERILVVTHFFPPKHISGTENYTFGLASTLLNRGFHVEVLCAENWEEGDSYWNGVSSDEYKGLLVHRINLNWTKAKNPNEMLYDSNPVERWLDSFLEKNHFDIAHVTSVLTLGIGVIRSIKGAGIPLVLTLMDFWFLCPSIQLLKSNADLCNGVTSSWECQSCLLENSNLYSNLNRYFPSNFTRSIFETFSQVPLVSKQRGLRGYLLDMKDRKQSMRDVLKLPDIILTHSETVRSYFKINNFSPIIVLPFGNDLGWIDDYRGKTETQTIRFGYIGQINEIKGVHFLIDAFNRADVNSKAQLDIWGDLSKNIIYAQELNKLKKGNDRITFKQKFNRDKLSEVYSNIDVLVVPSVWYENSPLVIQEAFATKTPVIATNLGGMAEAVKHNVNGLLFERHDLGDLSNQIQRIINEPDLLGSLIHGIPQVKTIDQEIIELEQLYNRLIDDKSVLS